jgi:hypothetical protein
MQSQTLNSFISSKPDFNLFFISVELPEFMSLIKKKPFIIASTTVITLTVLVLIISWTGIIDSLARYLSISEETNANILLVEGWLPEDAILRSRDEFRSGGYQRIVTTGINSSAPFINIHSNGSLVFSTGKWFALSDDENAHVIEVFAKSELGGSDRAHFNLYINNIRSGEFFAEKNTAWYSVSWQGKLKDIDSITVQFDNDSLGENTDRNLYVKSIRADRRITIPYLDNSVYDIITSSGHLRINNNINSSAENAKVRLMVAGIDSSLITAVPAVRVKINRTLTSAIAFRDWLNNTDIDIKGINIVSLGPHSRRTWMTYNKVLHKKYGIGIIAVPNRSFESSRSRKVFRTLREAAGLLYYRILLLSC